MLAKEVQATIQLPPPRIRPEAVANVRRLRGMTARNDLQMAASPHAQPANVVGDISKIWRSKETRNNNQNTPYLVSRNRTAGALKPWYLGTVPLHSLPHPPSDRKDQIMYVFYIRWWSGRMTKGIRTLPRRGIPSASWQSRPRRVLVHRGP